MVVRDRSFPRGSPVCSYWLSRCEGFTVRRGVRTLGVVERLAVGMPSGRVETLVLRKRHGRRRVLDAGQVLAVVPGRQLLLARRPRRTAPVGRALRGTARSAAAATPVVAALATALAAVLWAFAIRAAVELRLAAVRAVRVMREELRDCDLRRPSLVRLRLRLPEVRWLESEGPPVAANDYVFALRNDQQPLGRGWNAGPTRIR